MDIIMTQQTSSAKRIQYAQPEIQKETFVLTATNNSAFGFMNPVLYDEGWNSRGWGGNGSFNNGITRLTLPWWRYNGTPGNPGRINEIAVRISSGSVVNTWLSFTTTLCVADEKYTTLLLQQTMLLEQS